MTGVGLLTPLGIGTELSWGAILASESGIAGITAFDAAAFSCPLINAAAAPEASIDRSCRSAGIAYFSSRVAPYSAFPSRKKARA